MKYLSSIGLRDYVGLFWKLNCSLAMRNCISSSKYAYWKAYYEVVSLKITRERCWMAKVFRKCGTKVKVATILSYTNMFNQALCSTSEKTEVVFLEQRNKKN